jgi:hypothetical protein
MHEGSLEAGVARRMPDAWDRPDDPVMGLLRASLPLSLIMDLVMPAGPHSRELLATEPADGVAWLDDL